MRAMSGVVAGEGIHLQNGIAISVHVCMALIFFSILCLCPRRVEGTLYALYLCKLNKTFVGLKKNCVHGHIG